MRRQVETDPPSGGPTGRHLDIAFVSNVVYPYVTGGAQKRIHEIGKRLVDNGHTVTVYGRKWWDGPSETTIEGVRLRGVAPPKELYVDDRRSITEAISFAGRVLPPVWTHGADHDLIDVSVFPYFPVLTSAFGAARSGTPLATTWHEVWGDYWHEYLGTFGGAGQAVERLAARVPQHPIAVSEHTARELTTLGFERADIDVVPNGVDIEAVDSVDPAPDGYDVIFAGRLIAEKRLDTAIRTCDRLAATRDFRFGIVGDGPERDRLERLAGTTRMSDRIDFLGRLEEHEDVIAQLKAADVFFLPSTREGFGITIVEAMAAGCTIVAVDAPNSAAAEVVADAGFTAPSNEADLVDCLERALDGGRPPESPRTAAHRYSWNTVAARAEEQYQRIAASKS